MSSRLLRTLIVVSLLPIVAVPLAVDRVGAAPAAPVAADVRVAGVSTTSPAHDASFELVITGLPGVPVKGLVSAERLPSSDPANLLPYYRQGFDASGASKTLTVPASSFQPGGSYRWRAEIWFVGEGADHSPQSNWFSFSTPVDADSPRAPYPLRPFGDLNAAGVILRADDSAAPKPGGGAIVEYRFILRGPLETDGIVWETTVSAAAGVTAVAVPNNVMVEGQDYRWAVYSKDAGGQFSDRSRWRWVRALSRSIMDSEYWYIDHRAGSYAAGQDAGEASGLVASKQYPGVYWFIRDNAPNDDRRFLYAIRIDQTSGLLGNVDGVVTKEIPVTGADNLDWEALTVDDSGNLWIADHGTFWDQVEYDRNSDPGLPDTRLIRIAEPNPDIATSVAAAQTVTYQYPGNENMNSESLFWWQGSPYVVSKESGGVARVFRVDLATGAAVFVARVGSPVEEVTDTAVSADGQYLAMTTGLKRLVVFRSSSTRSGDARIADLVQSPDRISHYYYRSAARLDADGQLQQRYDDPRYSQPAGIQPAQSPQYTQLTMQVEGAAFAESGSGAIALISEFGDHVMNIPAASWSQRAGDGWGDGNLVAAPRVSQGSPQIARPQAGDPVNTFSGNFWHSEVDLEPPGGLWGLGFGRSYNSTEIRSGVLGVGWSTSLDVRLWPGEFEVIASLPDGREVSFPKSATGQYDRPAEFRGRLSDVGGGFDLAMDDGSGWHFDADGRLQSMSHWTGQAVTVQRDGQQRIATLTHNGGQVMNLLYTTSGKLQSVSYPDGRSVGYGYDSNGNLVSVTRPGNRTTIYVVNAAGLVEEIKNAAGQTVVSSEYDLLRRVVSQTQAVGGMTEFEYQPGQTTVITETPGGSVTYRHDTSGRVLEVTDSLGASTDFEYDVNGNPTQSVDRSGRVDELTWDANGQLVGTSSPGVGAYSSSLDSQLRPTSTSGPNGTTSMSYVGQNRIPSVITQANGSQGTFTVAFGLVTAVTDADGIRSELDYDSQRRVVASRDGLGNEVTFTYDGRGNKTSGTTPEGGTTVWTYDTADRVSTETNPDGGVTTYAYDLADRVVMMRDALGAETHWTYNAAGQVVSQTRSNGAVYTNTYDSFARIVGVTGPNGYSETFEYGPLGRLVSHTGAGGEVVQYTYDLAGNVTTVSSPVSGTKTVGRDAAGNATSIADGSGKTVSRSYDPAGRVISETQPGGRTTSYTYDTSGRLASSTDPAGLTTSYAWTPANRPAAVHAPTGSTSYEYDDAGRLSSVTGPGGAVTAATRDGNGSITELTDPDGVSNSYAYSAGGQTLQSVTADGVSNTQTYDANGRVLTSRVGPSTHAGTVNYSWNPDGTLGSVSNANGAQTAYGYNQLGHMTSRVDPTGAQTTWTVDSAGRILTETDPNNKTTSYGYDALGRIISKADPSGRTINYAWTNSGNIASVTSGPDSTTFTYNANGDRVGATTAEGQWTWAYDAAGRMLSEIGPQGDQTSVAYDSQGRRASMSVPDGSTFRYDYDQGGRVAKVSAAETLADSFTWADGSSWDRQKWLIGSANGATTTVEGNRGAATATSASGSTMTATAQTVPLKDTETVGSFEFDSAANNSRLRIYARVGTSGSYRLEIRPDSSTARLYRATATTTTEIGSFSIPATGKRWFKLRVDESTISARVWSDGSTEPSSWQKSVPDTAIADPGKVRLQWARSTATTSSTVRVDDVKVNNLAADSNPHMTVHEEFDVPDSAAWPSVRWQTGSVTGATSSTVSGRGELVTTGSSGSSVTADMLAAETVNQSVRLSYRFPSVTSNNRLRVFARQQGSNSYRVEIRPDSTTARVYRQTGSTTTEIGVFPVPKSTTKKWIRFEVVDSTVSARVWEDGSNEPTSWAVSVSDNAVATSGRTRIQWARNTATTASTVEIDDVERVDLDRTVTSLASFNYSPGGRLLDEMGVDRTRNWQWADGKPLSVTDTQGSTKTSTQFGYGPTGKLSVLSGHQPGQFSYDPAGQLVAATFNGQTSTFSYDAAGRRVASVEGSVSTGFVYDPAGQLLSMTPSSGAATTFSYDGAGRRTSAVSGSVSVLSGYDGFGRLSEVERRVGGVVDQSQTRSYAPDGALYSVVGVSSAGTDSSRLSWDLLGGSSTSLSAVASSESGTTVTAAGSMVSLGGGLVSSPARDVFGSVLSSDLAAGSSYSVFGAASGGLGFDSGVRLGFRGEVVSAGLVYLRARSYDPGVGGFTTRDPLSEPVGSVAPGNPYHYVWGDPVNLVDPSGLRPDGAAVTDGLFGGLLSPLGRLGPPAPVVSPEPVKDFETSFG